MKRIATLLVALLASTALAQDGGGILALLGLDLALLAGSALLFAKTIQFAIEQIKGYWPGVPKALKMALPFVLGIGGSFVLSITVGITDPMFGSGSWIPYGIVTALIAGGWYETDKATTLRAGSSG